VRRKRDVVRFAERGRLKKSRDTAAAGCVCLQYIHSPCLQHATKIAGIVTILTSRDVHARWTSIAEQPQSREVIGRYGLFEPTNIQICELLSLVERLLSAVSAVGVDEELDFRTDCGSRDSDSSYIICDITADLHLDPHNPLLYPPAELLLQLLV
jgi:hypothetical protein